MGRPATAAVTLLSGSREPVRAATTANITLSGLQTIDGVSLEVGDRVLVKDQTDATENGIYDVSEGQWLRSADARSSRTLNRGTSVYIRDGDSYSGEQWLQLTENPDIGDDALSFEASPSNQTLARLGAVETAVRGSRFVTAAGNVTAGATDSFIVIEKDTPEATTVTLPPASGRTYSVTIKDGAGVAEDHNITIVPDGTDTIDGQSSFVLDSNYQAVTLRPKAGGWFIT